VTEGIESSGGVWWRALRESRAPLIVAAAGALYLAADAGAPAASRTWPLLLVLWGLLLAAPQGVRAAGFDERLRSRSLAAPAGLIVLGAALLAANLAPSFSFTEAFRRGWPWLLAGWGAFRLAERFIAVPRGRPGPRPAGVGALLAAAATVVAGESARAVEAAGGGWFRWAWIRLVRFD
jgi:hypothetical protein